MPLLFGGTLLGDVAAAAWGGACGAVLVLGGRRRGGAGRLAHRWKGRSLLQLVDLRVVLGQCLLLWSATVAGSGGGERRRVGGGGWGWRQALLVRG